MSNTSTFALFPDLKNLRALLRNRWTSVEVQSARFKHRSALTPGAWSTSAVLIRSQLDVLIYAEALDRQDGGEQFHLRFGNADEEPCRSYLSSSRPHFAPVSEWPHGITLPTDFKETGPRDAEIAFGARLDSSAGTIAASLAPLLWCCFRAGGHCLTFYADREIPLNVGVVQILDSTAAIKSAFRAASIRTL